MPSPAIDRQSLYLGVAAVAFAALAGISARMVRTASALSEMRPPATSLGAIAPYLGPSADTGRLAGTSSAGMVVRRDPLAGRAPSPVREVKRVSAAPAAAKAVTVDATQWVVSSILFEATRRSAIVNNAWVMVGDPVGGGARLSGIERKHVVVTDPNGIQHIVPIRRGEK